MPTIIVTSDPTENDPATVIQPIERVGWAVVDAEEGDWYGPAHQSLVGFPLPLTLGGDPWSSPRHRQGGSNAMPTKEGRLCLGSTDQLDT